MLGDSRPYSLKKPNTRKKRYTYTCALCSRRNVCIVTAHTGVYTPAGVYTPVHKCVRLLRDLERASFQWMPPLQLLRFLAIYFAHPLILNFSYYRTLVLKNFPTLHFFSSSFHFFSSFGTVVSGDRLSLIVSTCSARMYLQIVSVYVHCCCCYPAVCHAENAPTTTIIRILIHALFYPNLSVLRQTIQVCLFYL